VNRKTATESVGVFALRLDVGSEFQMGAVLEKNTILRLWPRVIEGVMCCKWGLRVKMCSSP